MSHPDPSVDYGDQPCKCGETAEHHVDGEFQCVMADCGCKEFEMIDNEKYQDTLNDLVP